MATVLQRTGSGAQYGKMTISFWVKRSKLGEQGIFGRRQGSATANLSTCHFGGDDSLLINFRDGGGTSKYYMITNRKFRDVGAWYHIVFAIDGTNSTAGDRSKLYINGVRETSFALLNNPSSTGYEVNMFAGGSYNTYIARGLRSQTDAWLTFEGCMSHFHCSTGYTYDADVFGSTDSTTGEWQINTSPTFTPGTDGFTILKDGITITDQSANSNNFTVYSGTLTKTEDNPSNVFATLNNVLGTDVVGSTCTFSNGNTVAEDPNGSASGINPNFISTLGMPSKGKWYCELQPSSFSTSSGHSIGIYRTKGSTDDTGEGDLEGSAAKIRYIFADTAIYIIKYGTNDQTGLTAITSGQTVGMALDLDNGTLQYYVNGSTRANAITGINSANDGFDYFFHAGLESSSSGRYGKYSWNFGNGAFGSTQLTGTTYQDSQGRGIFKHQPPTNFLALCTRNLNV